MKVLAIGGSRHIGYYSAIRLLESGATVTFLLRNPSVFDDNEVMQEYVKSGKARLVKGDALVQEDCKKSWDEAAKGEPEGEGVDVLLFTVGGAATFRLTQGFVITPPNLVTQSLLNTLTTLPSPSTTKIIVISAAGLTHTSHKSVPFPLKTLYRLITVPHKDKIGAERVVAHCAGWTWNAKDDGEPGENIMGGPEDWRKRAGLPEEGKLKEAIVVRPSLLTDGDCYAEKVRDGKRGYRVGEGDLSGAWTISRKDVAHFLVEGALKNWDQWKGKYVSIAY